MGGGMALNQLLIVMDGVDDPPWRKRFFTNRINTFLDATYIVPQKIGGMSLRLPTPEAADRAGLLHRRHQRADRRARPGAHPPGPHGPPHLVPHADEGRPQGHLRALHREGRPRSRARHAEAPRRDGAHHARLLAGDDRAGLLDGADLRAQRRAAGLRVGRPRRGDDHRRVGHRGRRRVPSPRTRGRSRSTRPATRSPATSTWRTPVHAPVDPHARLARSATTRPREKDERFSHWRHREFG